MTKVIAPNEIYKCLALADLPGEVWKDIIGFEGYYQISNMGRVKGMHRPLIRLGRVYKYACKKLLALTFAGAGYLRIILCKDGVKKSHYVHILVANAFIPNPENKPTVNHKKGIKTDNRATEIEWATRSENTTHAHNTGLIVANFGENAASAKLKNCDIPVIREMLKNGYKARMIALKYNVSNNTIYSIKNGKWWSKVI